MIDINTALQNILKAVYGKDVRQSIHDAIYQMNQNANEAIDLAQIKFGTSVINPTSPVGKYVEGTVYFNVLTGVIWKLSGGSWTQLGSMKAIANIAKTSTTGLIDTYTITYNDGSTSTYDVANGEKGASIVNVTKGATVGNVDHYDINLSDGTTTPNGFDVANGVSIQDISLASTVGNVKNYEVNLSDGTKTPNGFSVTDGISNYVHIRYSANFDGQGMVAVPTDQTVYIGLVVTTQSSAPTDPAVYSWVRFIGKSGAGSGDMLKADYSTLYTNVVDKAAALYDGTKEISASQLMDKDSYASKGVAGTVDKATQLIDVTNSKTADTVLLANLTDDGTGLKYKGAEIGGKVAIDDVTIKEVSGKLQVAAQITNKLVNLDSNGKIDYSNVKGTPTMPTITDTYSATSSDGMSGKAVASALSDGLAPKANKTLIAEAYSDTKAYSKGDIVQDGIKVYEAIQDSIPSGTPLSNTTYWKAYDSLGDKVENVSKNFNPNPTEYDLLPYLNTTEFMHTLGFSKVLKFGRICVLTIKYLQPKNNLTESGAKNFVLFSGLPDEIKPALDNMIIFADTNHAIFETINGAFLNDGRILLTHPGKGVTISTQVYLSITMVYVSKE